MIEYTPQELARFSANDEILGKLQEARATGDHEAEKAFFRQLVIPAVSLLMMKENLGSDYIKDEGLNTSEAERVFGKDWLERDNDELAKLLYS